VYCHVINPCENKWHHFESEIKRYILMQGWNNIILHLQKDEIIITKCIFFKSVVKFPLHLNLYSCLQRRTINIIKSVIQLFHANRTSLKFIHLTQHIFPFDHFVIRIIPRILSTVLPIILSCDYVIQIQKNSTNTWEQLIIGYTTYLAYLECCILRNIALCSGST
jgi:hypothetical protein